MIGEVGGAGVGRVLGKGVGSRGGLVVEDGTTVGSGDGVSWSALGHDKSRGPVWKRG